MRVWSHRCGRTVNLTVFVLLFLLSLPLHALAESRKAVTLIDNSGWKVRVISPIRSIICITSSASEIVYAVGEGSKLTGRDSGAAFPPAVTSVPVVAGTSFSPNLELIISKKPDHPNYEDAVKILKARGVKNIILIPLMLVAGDHANNDMVGDEPDSWKSRLISEGFNIVGIYMHGLGANPAFQDIYVQHINDAIKESAK